MQDRSARHHEIRVEGILNEGWSAWFDPYEISSEEGVATVISGPVTDQSALHGLLTKINDLGLTLISVRRIES
jgi:hypothetical protein